VSTAFSLGIELNQASADTHRREAICMRNLQQVVCIRFKSETTLANP